MGRTGGREKAGSWCTEARLCVAVCGPDGKGERDEVCGELTAVIDDRSAEAVGDFSLAIRSPHGNGSLRSLSSGLTVPPAFLHFLISFDHCQFARSKSRRETRIGPQGCTLQPRVLGRQTPRPRQSTAPAPGVRQYARLAIVEEYIDRATGKNGDRAPFRRMMQDASRHRFDVLLFWSLDRLTREGTFMTLCYLRQLTDAGVKCKSYTEQYIDSLGIFGDAIVGIIGAIAAQERLRISERTKAESARVRASGTQLGRPRGGRDINLALARKLRAEGLSISEIAKRMKLSRSMVWSRLTEDARL